MAEEPDNLVLQLLRSLRADLGSFRAEWKAELRSEINSLRADVASDITLLRGELGSDIAGLRKETREQINGLRRTVVDYHASVVGHGMLISELEERMNRVEGVLNLPPLNPH